MKGQCLQLNGSQLSCWQWQSCVVHLMFVELLGWHLCSYQTHFLRILKFLCQVNQIVPKQIQTKRLDKKSQWSSFFDQDDHRVFFQKAIQFCQYFCRKSVFLLLIVNTFSAMNWLIHKKQSICFTAFSKDVLYTQSPHYVVSTSSVSTYMVFGLALVESLVQSH